MRPNSRRILGATLVVASLGAACLAFADDDVIATIGSQPVKASDLKGLMPPLSAQAREQAASDPKIVEERVRSAIGRKLLLDAALKQGVDKTPEVTDQVGRARDDVIIHAYLKSVALPPGFPTEQEVTQAYRERQQKFKIPELFHLAHIFIAVPPQATPQASAAAEQKARALAKKARQSWDDFPALAQAESDDRVSAAHGGDLGWVAATDMLKPILTAVQAVKGKGITEPVMANGGWHIIQVSGTLPPYLPPLDKVHDQIVATLTEAAINDYVNKLLAAKPLSINDAAAAKLFAAQP